MADCLLVIIWSLEPGCTLMTCWLLTIGELSLCLTSFCSHKRRPQITRIYEKPTETFRNPTPTTQENDRALEAMELIASLSENEIAQKNLGCSTSPCGLQSPSPTLKRRSETPLVLPCTGPTGGTSSRRGSEDPQCIPFPSIITPNSKFATRGGQSQDEPIQNALRPRSHHQGSQVLRSDRAFPRSRCLLRVSR